MLFAPPAAKSTASGRAPLERGHGRCSAKRPGNFGPPHTPRTAVSGRSGHSVGHAGRPFRRFSSPRRNPVLLNGQSCPRADEAAPASRPRKVLPYLLRGLRLSDSAQGPACLPMGSLPPPGDNFFRRGFRPQKSPSPGPPLAGAFFFSKPAPCPAPEAVPCAPCVPLLWGTRKLPDPFLAGPGVMS